MASVIIIIAIVLLPPLHVHYRPSMLHVAFETAASLIALLAAFLIFGRLRRRTCLNELVLACALASLALSNLLFVTVPTVTAMPRNLTVWASVIGSSLGALLFALAAFLPPRQLRWARPALAAGAGGAAAVIALTIGLVRGYAGYPVRGLAARSLHPAALPVPHSQPMLLAAQLTMVGLYGLAAVGHFNRSRQLGDEFFGWLAIAAVLATASYVSYSWHPSLDSQWAYTGETFRLSFYAVLLVGSAREIWSYWRALSDVAVLEERRRIARDLHDGLAQELACVARNLDSLQGAADEATFARVRQAVDRAQLESRRSVHTLTATGTQALDVALADATGEVAQRLQIELEFDAAPDVRLSASRAQAMVRIACEAVTNAARHSGTTRVNLSLEQQGSRVRLRVSDDGCGFDTADPGGGFGLISMREHARSAGGELKISSAPGRGSKVEVAL